MWFPSSVLIHLLRPSSYQADGAPTADDCQTSAQEQRRTLELARLDAE